MKLLAYTTLSDDDQASILDRIESHTILEHAVRWAFSHNPPLESTVVHQDEYTLDVCFTLPGGLTLAYDTT